MIAALDSYSSDEYQAESYEDAQRYIQHCKQFGINVVKVDWTKNIVTTNNAKTSNISSDVPVTKPGVFKKDDDIFVVKFNKDKTHLYALQLVEAPSDRVTESGDIVDFEFEYARGAIYKLRESDRLSMKEAEEHTIKYSRCIVCGRRLKVAESVKRGIGPKCAQIIGGYA